LGGGVPFRGAGFAEEVPDELLGMRSGDGVRGIAPEPEAETAFVGVVDVAVVDEGVDGGETAAFFPCVGVGGGLELFAVGC
jgi:hypothetical protein